MTSFTPATPTTSMDQIHIEGIRAFCIIGVHDWERQAAQPIDIDLVLTCDLQKAAQSDDLNHTLDYKQITDQVVKWAQQSRYQLIESLAETLCQSILHAQPLAQQITLQLKKPQAVPYIQNVGLKITRTRGA